MTDLSRASIAASSAGAGLTDTSRLASKDNLEKAGQRFEAIFVNMMLTSMRKAKLTDGDLFENDAMNQFRDMQDQQLAQTMARTAPMGIGKAMTEFLSRAQPTPLADDPAAAPDGGAATP